MTLPRQRQTTASIVFEAIGAMATLLLVGASLNLINGIWIMLALGILHDQWPAIPALGFWPTYVLLCALFAAAGIFREARKPAGKDHA